MVSAFAECCYGDHSLLVFGDSTILSASGAQQGDPVGCILLSLGLQPLIDRIQAEVPNLTMHAWELDDENFIGRLLDEAKAFEIVRDFSPRLGLSVNMKKSVYWRGPEIWGYNLPIDFLSIPDNKDKGFVMLGAPVGSPAFT